MSRKRQNIPSNKKKLEFNGMEDMPIPVFDDQQEIWTILKKTKIINNNISHAQQKGRYILKRIRKLSVSGNSANEQLITNFNIWQNCPYVKNYYHQVDSFKEALEGLKIYYSQKSKDKSSIKIVYNLNKYKFDSNDKDNKDNLPDLDEYEFLFNASKVSFSDCSTYFIRKYFSSIKQDDNSINEQTILFKKCKINDFDFEKSILDRLNFYTGTNNRVIFSFNKCNNITSYTIQLLSQLKCSYNENGKQILSLENAKNFGLKLQSQHHIQPNYLRGLFAQLFSKLLIKLKLVNLTQCQGSDVLKDFLSYRQDSNTYFIVPYDEIKQLKEISFDRTVCNKFDDLPLHLNWSKLNKISYNGLNNSNKRDVLTFNKLLPSSFPQLKSLKLRGCDLTSEFFQNLASMQFCSSLKSLDFQNCQIDLEAFKQFISLGITDQLTSLNLKQTNIDDDVCSLIGMQTSIDDQQACRLKLRHIDVSEIQSDNFTSKGIKYLLQSNYLIRININHNDCVDDTLADHIVQLVNTRLSLINEYNTKIQQMSETQDMDNIENLNGDYLLKKINVEGCKNITSSFFMTLFEKNFLKNIELLNVQETSICNNFIDILSKQEDKQNDDVENNQQKDNQATQDQKSIQNIEQSESNTQSNQQNQQNQSRKKNEESGNDHLLNQQDKNKEAKQIPDYYEAFNGFYDQLADSLKIKVQKLKPVRKVKDLISDIKRSYEKVMQKFDKEKQKQQNNKSKQTRKQDNNKKNNQNNENINGQENIVSLKSIQYLNISKCKLINGEGIIKFINQAQCKESLRHLNMAGVIFYIKDTIDSLVKPLNLIIQNFLKLEKLDISENSLPSHCYDNSNVELPLGKLIKLKANQTNFDLKFFGESLWKLQELQLKDCKQITSENLENFIIKIGKYGSEVFNIFKFISYFKNIFNDDILYKMITNYKNINQLHYWNLQSYNLLELDYGGDEKINQIFENHKIEILELSNTRVCNDFVSSFLQLNQKKDYQRIHLVLNNCPLLDGSLFEKISKMNLIQDHEKNQNKKLSYLKLDSNFIQLKKKLKWNIYFLNILFLMNHTYI